MPMIETRDGTRLYVKSWGEGTPVILIHGWPLSCDSWDPVSHAIAEAGYRAIAYDRRGFGRSDQPSGGYDYDTFADDLADVMAATGATADAALIGFSMGGGEVARYLSRHAGRGVSRVALVSSVVPCMLQTADNPEGVPQSTFDQMTEAMLQDRARFMASFFKEFFGMGWMNHPVSDEMLETCCTTAMMAGLRPTLLAAKAFATTDFRSDLPSFTLPTLIIHGTADKTVPIEATSRAVARAVPHATLIEYDGEPHGIFATQNERLKTNLLDFLAGRAPDDRQDVLDAMTASALVTPPV
jgi:pimeloyl-ACP methyl ester carboxylesterase